MKTLNGKTSNLKLQALALAALLPMAAQASDRWEHRDSRSNLSGRVEVSHEIPGGVITVGADWGRQRPQPQVVVVENSRPEVIVIEKDRGHGRGRHHHHNRHVTIVREQPRQVIIVKEQPREVVIVKEEPACNRAAEVHTQIYRDGNQVSVQKSGPNGTYQYYKDANQVSERRTGPDGTYQYYEDAHQVSIQENRDGRPQRNVYVRK